MQCGARFPAFYGNNDGILYENSGLIAGLIEYLKQYDISRLKISSIRVHLGLGGSHSNLVED